MNALVKKEIRLLLPSLAAALALAIIPVWVLPASAFSPGTDGGPAALLYLLGIMLLALASFGREIGLRTLPFIMAQPLERARIWWTKIVVLALGVALSSTLWCLSARVCFVLDPSRLVPLEILLQFGLFALAFTAGSLWMTLLLRQTMAAFWLTLLIPMAGGGVLGLMGATELMIFAAIGLYVVAAYFLAKRRFLHLQDTAWTGDAITLSRTTAAAGQTTGRERRPWAALLGKEMQLQQFTLAGMICLLVLHLGAVFLRKVGAHVFGALTMAALDAFGMLWLVVPWLAGSLSVAEERQLGTLDSLLCLPMSRRIQFVIKLFSVLILGLLATVLLCAIEGVANGIGVGTRLGESEQELAVGFFLSMSLLSFYASTLMRGVVPALAAGVVVAVVVCWPAFDADIWTDRAVPLLVVALIWLAYGNFRYVLESGIRLRRNILVLISLFIATGVLATAIYHRVWEQAMPLEGPHGAARWPAQKPVLLRNCLLSGLAAVLPDGRLWEDGTAYEASRMIQGERDFVPGSNWVDAYRNYCETAAIRSDGTLWVSEKPQWHAAQPMPPMVQFGTESNWQSLARDARSISSVFLLKRDGSLWFWGTNALDESAWAQFGRRFFDPDTYPGLRAVAPVRLDAQTNWARLMQGNPWTYAWNRDGLAWVLHGTGPNEVIRQVGVKLAQDTEAERVPEFDHIQFKSMNTSEIYVPVEVGVRNDGTLWYWNWNKVQHPNRGPLSERGASTGLVQIGKESDWAQVAGGATQMLGLKTDGSIWKWNLFYGNNTMIDLLQNAPERLGTHHDWIAVGYWLEKSVALSADGTLWRWPNMALPGENDNDYMAPSMRPAKIENILEARN